MRCQADVIITGNALAPPCSDKLTKMFSPPGKLLTSAEDFEISEGCEEQIKISFLARCPSLPSRPFLASPAALFPDWLFDALARN